MDPKLVLAHTKLMSSLFEVSVKTINEHLINIFKQNELKKEATVRNFRIVQKEGSREVAISLMGINSKNDRAL